MDPENPAAQDEERGKVVKGGCPHRIATSLFQRLTAYDTSSGWSVTRRWLLCKDVAAQYLACHPARYCHGRSLEE